MRGSHEFPRSERLDRRADFLRAYAHGRKIVGRHFICYLDWHPGKGRRFGTAVSRRIGKAVTRNRIKRYLREIYRQQRPELPQELTLVIVARQPAASLNYHESERAVRSLLRRGDVLDDE